MADTKISALTAAAALAGTEAVPVVQSAATVKTTLSAIAAYVRSTITGYLTAANNLSDLASAATARTNLGLGTAATQASTAFKPAAPSIQSVTSAATVTPTFSDDMVKITAQAVGLTLANPSGTAVPGWGIAIRIKDNGSAQTIAYGTQYRAVGVTLPTTTVAGKVLYLGCIWNDTATKLDVVAVAQEA